MQRIERPGYSIELYVPDANDVQQQYLQQKNAPFPHWSKLWPSSLGLTDFIFHHPEYVQGKNVLELAAGLGLPSLMAARYAKTVCASDYVPEAVDAMKRSSTGVINLSCRLLDWNDLPNDLAPDVLLLSDINYDPGQFDHLYKVLQRFLQQGVTILLSTPQRLMAKPFIEKLLPDTRQQFDMEIDNTFIFIAVIARTAF